MPLRQHVGIAARPCVTVGEIVSKGQLIAQSHEYVGMRLHAPTSGVISAIGEFPAIHPGRGTASAIELTSDGEDRGSGKVTTADPAKLATSEIHARITAAGIVGLGGAGFPAHVKIREGGSQPLEMLIINGVECEPYICCDDRVARENPAEVVGGAVILARLMEAKECVIAVEDDMPDAFAALAAAAEDPVRVVSVPAIYPAGGEKQLITVLTGKEVPSGLLPIHVGMAVLNVQTVRAVCRAVTARAPLIDRMITVAGDIERPGNFEVPIGIPVRDVLDHLDALPLNGRTVLSGGPMMGTIVHDLDAPITKTVSCLLVLSDDDGPRTPQPCIRCGDCIPVCPVRLNPQQLFESIRAADFDSAQDYHLFDCIDCGCCDYVCPSSIPLVQHYRHAKSAIEALDRDRAVADRARENHETRSARDVAASAHSTTAEVELADLDLLDENSVKHDIDAVLERVRNKRDQGPGQ